MGDDIMLSFILWIFGCIVVIPAMIYIFNKVMKNRAVKKGGAMTKDRCNTIASRLLLITLLSTFVCVAINSYMPLIITGAAFVGFLVFARKRYGYRAVEYRGTPIEMMTKEELFKKFDEEKTFMTINSCSIYHSDDK